MMIRRRILQDQKGVATVEMAIALPILVVFIWGIFQIGLLFQANAGMQHALGEGARYATIFPTPSDTQIRNRVLAKKFGTYNGNLGSLQIADTSSGGIVQYKDMTLTYNQQMHFLFIPVTTVTLTRSKRVYMPT
jgi:Flp pilus assembly protein TadG